MRVFLFGMQSSGASLATYLLGQVPEAVVLVDLYSYEVMPPIEAPTAKHVIGKAVVTATHELDGHLNSYRPDRSILLLRDPVQNYVSLSRKEYANDDGGLDEKFRKLDEVFRQRDRFDLVLKYEDVVTDPEGVVARLRGIGFPATSDLYSFPRSREEITEFNLEHCEWCRERYGRGWSFGNIRGDGMKHTLVYKVAPPAIHQKVGDLCPAVVRYYQREGEAKVGRVARAGALVEDALVRPVRDVVRHASGRVRRTLGQLRRSLSR